MATIKVDLRVGETLRIGDAVIVLEQKSGQLARLVIEADKSIPVRKESEPNASIRLIADKGLMTTA